MLLLGFAWFWVGNRIAFLFVQNCILVCIFNVPKQKSFSLLYSPNPKLDSNNSFKKSGKWHGSQHFP